MAMVEELTVEDAATGCAGVDVATLGVKDNGDTTHFLT